MVADDVADKLTVLLIEDDFHDVEAVQRALETVQPSLFALKHVTKFRDAIRLIHTESFHVVILDLGLPDSVGLNGVDRLMKLIPNVPVIVLTGTKDEDTSLKGIELGAQEFLDKNSVSPKELIRTIRHATKRKQFSIQQVSIASGRRGARVETEAEISVAEKLAEIVKDTSGMVRVHTTALLETKLSKQQRSIVSDIEETSQRSLDAARAANLRSGSDGGSAVEKTDGGDLMMGRLIGD